MLNSQKESPHGTLISLSGLSSQASEFPSDFACKTYKYSESLRFLRSPKMSCGSSFAISPRKQPLFLTWQSCCELCKRDARLFFQGDFIGSKVNLNSLKLSGDISVYVCLLQTWHFSPSLGKQIQFPVVLGYKQNRFLQNSYKQPCCRLPCLSLLGRKGDMIKSSFRVLFLKQQLKINIPKGRLQGGKILLPVSKYWNKCSIMFIIIIIIITVTIIV